MENRKNKNFISNLVIVVLAIVALFVVTATKDKMVKKAAYLKSPEILRSVNYEQVQPGDEKVEGCGNKVNFSAYFTKDIDGDGRAEKLYGSCQRIGDTSQLFIDVNIDGDGHIENGVITIDGVNFRLAMNMLKDSLLKNNVVSEDVQQIELNNVVAGNSEVLMGAISSKIRDIDGYTKVNHVTLTGTYIPAEEGATPVQINKTIDLTVDWYGTTKAYIRDGYEKYSRSLYVHDEDKPDDENTLQAVTFSFSVMETREELIVKEQEIEVTIPKCVGDDPVSVTTNGEYTYDPETRILTMKRDTSSKSVDYAINVKYRQSALNKLKWSDSGYSLIARVKAKITCYNNQNEEFENPITSEEVTGSSVVSFDIFPGKIQADYVFNMGILTSGYRNGKRMISKQNIYDQYNTDEELEDIAYSVKWRVEKNRANYVTAEVSMYDYGEQVNGRSMKNYTRFTGMRIENRNFIPDNEKISIYNRDTGEIIQEFYGSELKGPKTFYYEDGSDIRSIRIKVSQSSNYGSLEIYNFKVLEVKKIQENYTLEEVMNMTELGSKMEGGINPSSTIDVTGVDYVDLVGNASDMNMSLSKTAITSMDTLEDERITINLPIDAVSSSWKDGIFLVQIPNGVAKVKIKNVTANDANVEILGYDVFQSGVSQFIKVITSNEEATNYSINIDCDLIPDPRTASGAITVKTYAYNPESSVYWNSTRDIYDVDGDGDKTEVVGYATAKLNMMASSTFVTTETVSNYNESGDITIAPNIAIIDNQTNSATVNVTVLNNYENSVKNVVVLGKTPFEGNTYVDSENELRSTFTATMKDTGIIVPNSIKNKTTVYYSAETNPTKDIEDAANGWKEASEWTSLENVKNYLIVIDKTLGRREAYEFKYDVSIPEDLSSNNAAYSCHKAYFDLVTSEGDVDLSIQPTKVGVRVVKPFSFQLNKYKRGTNLQLQGAIFKLSEDVPTGEEDNARILITDYRGKFTVDNLVVNQVYNLEEIKAPNHFMPNEGVIQFKVIETSIGVYEFVDVSEKKFDGTPTITVDESGKVNLQADIEDEPKFRLNITKIDGESGDTIPGIKFKLNDDTIYKTMSTGVIHIDDLVVGEDYSLEEIEANGYYTIEDTIDFKIVKNQDNTYTFVTDSEYIPEIPTIVYDDTTTYIDVSITITNAKMPRFNLKVQKVEENNENNKLANAQYRLISVDDEKTAYYTTDENGEFIVPELIQKNVLSSRTGKYTLKEEQEPYGYTLNNEEIEFYVQKNASNELEVNVTDRGNLTSLKDIRVEGTTVTLVVEDKPLFRLTKTDKDTGLPLANVGFTINEINVTNDQGSIGDYAKDARGNYIGEQNEQGMYIVRTDENGVLTAPLRDGTYKIVEVEFPEGYEEKINSEIITVSGGRSASSEVEPLPEVTLEDNTTTTLEIDSIEDLVRFANKINNGETRYENTKVVLTKNLDFTEDSSYENPDDTSFGDLNRDGNAENIKAELGSQKGFGFPQIGKKDPDTTDMSVSTPLGRYFCFGGIFDGQGHEIRNIYMKCIEENGDSVRGGGLFVVLNDAKIVNFGITGKMECYGSQFGSMVGCSASLYMENCHSKCDIEDINSDSSYEIGCLVGYSYGDIYLNNCYNEGNISGKYEVGGLIGQISQGNSGEGHYVIINNCHNSGNLVINAQYANYCGGCVGYLSSSSDLYIYNTYNEGDIVVSSNSNYTYDLGGIVGYTSGSGTVTAYIDNCRNTGEITSNDKGTYRAGGLLGNYSYSTSKITNCYNTGKVSAPTSTSTYYGVGGIIGSLGGSATIENIYNAGNVLGDERVGGIVGYKGGNTTIKNCYNTGKIEGRSCVGGIVGDSDGSTSVQKCYNTGNINYVVSSQMLGYDSQYFGGIMGRGYSSSTRADVILDSYNLGDITQYNTREAYTGGISGSRVGYIKNCYNQGNIIITPSTQTYLNNFFVGGISVSGNGVINCSNSGNISITDSTGQNFSSIYVGGIVYDGSVPTNCYNTGNINVDIITATSGMYIGGIGACTGAGYCYNTGDITVNVRSAAEGIYIGGITGSYSSGSLGQCYNTGSITYTVGSSGWVYVGGIAGSSTCNICYNTGDVNVDIQTYSGTQDHYVGGICGSGKVTDSYNIGNVYNKVTNPTVYHTRTSPISTDSSSEHSGYYLNGIQVVGRNVSSGSDIPSQTWETGLSESVMKSEHFLSNSVWVYNEGSYPTLNIALAAPGQKISRLEMNNTKKHFDIVIGIDKNTEGLNGGGQTSGEYTDAYSEIDGIKWVDTLEYNQTSEKAITITPNENYMITKITINGEEIPFQAAADDTYTFESGYFANVTEFKKIMVTFEEKSSVLKIKKTDANSNPLKDAKFKIEQVENRTVLPDSSVIGSVSGTGPIYTTVDKTTSYNEVLGSMTKPSDISYGFEQVDGKYVSTNGSVNNGWALSYMEIDLTGKAGKYVAVVNAKISSENSDRGYATIKYNTNSNPVYGDSLNRFIYISGTNNTDTDYTSMKLNGGSKYYLYFGYKKDNSVNTGDDKFTINSINIYKAIETSYGFTENNGVYTSSNQGLENTTCTSRIGINLSNFQGRYKILMNTDLSSKANVDRATLAINGCVDRAYEYSKTGTDSDGAYYFVVDGGRSYIVTMSYQKGTGTGVDHGTDSFTISNIRFELDDSDFYTGTDLVTNENGEYTGVLTPGKYIVTETEAPEGYVLDNTPQEIVLSGGQDNTLTFVNQEKSKVTTHYVLKGTGPNRTTLNTRRLLRSGEPVELIASETQFGLVGSEYTTRPKLKIVDNEGKTYVLEKNTNGEYVVPENATGVYTTDAIHVYYNYEREAVDYNVHYLYDNVEDTTAMETNSAPIGSEITEYTDKVRDGYILDRVENLPLTIDEESYKNNIYVYYVTDEANYEVHYFYAGVEDEDVAELQNTAMIRDEISSYTEKEKDGYCFKDAKALNENGEEADLPLIVKSDESKNIINVYYEKDDFEYTVHYFIDGEEDTSKIGIFSAQFESEIKLADVDVNTNKPAGYKVDKVKALNENGEEADLPLIIKTDISKNVINVYYVKDNFAYTVHYFYDGTEDESKKIESTALFGSQITEVPDKNIIGYKHDHTDGLPLTISAVASENVVNVYYVKDNFGYTVHYFYDGTEDESKKIESTAEFGSTISEVPDKNIAGYKHDHTDGLPLTISAVASENVVNVYYVKDNIGYTVHYFYDNVEDESKKIESTALFGSQITEVPDKNIEGYKHDHTEGLPLTISAVASENVVNVYYIKDNFGYTVHYFYDGTEDVSKKIETTALFESTITEVPDKNITGYKHQRTEGLPLTISADESENVVNVYYIPDELGYSIHYFYDGVEDTTKVVNNNATFGSVITEVDVETNKIEGYKHDHTDGLPLTISAVTADNVINVYYVKDNFAYTVHYFYDNVEDESKKIEDTALFGSQITEVPDKNITGYQHDHTEGLPLTISAVPANNVVNVYYVTIPDGTVIVKYVDNLTGDTISEDTTMTEQIGTGYTVTRKTIPGHKLDIDNLPTNETGTFKDTPQTVTYKYIELRPYDLVVRYTSGEDEHDEAKVLVHFGETTINDYTTNGELHIADIELTDLVTETYTVYETETPEYCKPVVTEQTPAVVELTGRLNTTRNVYEYVANYGDIEGFEVIIDETNKKVIFDIRAEKNEKYDLAIRKFITKIGDKEITDRVPQVLVSEDNKITYLENNNIEEAVNSQEITYTIRMYNESGVRARGKQIVEYVPEGLVFVPENSINKQYSWKMYKVGANGEAVEVTDAKEATVVVTDYLDGKDITAFDVETKEVSYLDVQAVFKVDESKITRADRIVENKVQITPNKNDDNTDNDTSTEKVYVKYFDLSVEKYIQRVVVNTNGNETTREVGYEKKGELVKVDVKNSEAKNTKLTITYGILVKNVGEIPGYATEITDYIPEDFKLLSTDEWTLNGNTAVSTKLSDKLLNPGESATLEVTFEWDLASGNVGTRRNEAEITEYTNDFDAEDVTKDNKDGEDILVTLKTGSEQIAVVTAIAAFTTVVALGVLVIKRKI